ncbi:growth-regulating factor 5-like isoform X2 [Prosopis cineraria]|uniref:growth-regulating factor 5-like isoform X2 n=1 Tax=Prosopis cineraria TaxID=364024 RepID=UPI00240EEFF1|nr:growth-regulating factor 5-like isoform X2 [Prosopis cineraria]XP_054791123.1 growth-regulating factor 5-like isoform X2 [Prosopis cineraria]
MISQTSVTNRSPFTAIQWQELEQQALIFKYLVSGSPIPPDLIYSVKRSLDSSLSSSSSRLFPFHPIGWGCLEMGYGRKVDPEPGRCRRTDGKKWRCSKEAYPDSKYCERHMHRGRNRSRKPVEISSATATTGISTNTSQPVSSSCSNTSLTMINPNPPSTTSFPLAILPSSMPSDSQPYYSHIYQNSSLSPLFYTHSTSCRPLDYDFPSQKSNTHQLFLDSGSYSRDEYYRHVHGMRGGVDERAFFPEASGGVRSFPDSYQQLPMSSCEPHSKSQFPNMNDNPTPRQQEGQHCFVLERDFKSPGQLKHESETEMTQRSLHHFFGEWPPKDTDSWLDLASNSRIP